MQNLKRYPVRQHELLQAWDSADELILQHLNSIDLIDKKILIVNDQFGALSCGLKQWDITVLTDSFVSFQGIKLNSQNQISPLTSFLELKGMYDYVLIQMPKNLSYLEDLLCHLSHHLHEKSQVIIGVMLKHLPSSSFDLIQKYIGSTTTSLAQKKRDSSLPRSRKGKSILLFL